MEKTRAEQKWEQFIGLMNAARSGPADGTLPVAVVLIPYVDDGKGFMVDANADAIVLTEAGVPEHLKEILFRRIVEGFDTDTMRDLGNFRAGPDGDDDD